MSSKQTHYLLYLSTLSITVIFILQVCQPKQEEDHLAEARKSALNYRMKGTFIGSESCKSCHSDEYAKWENSHHHLAMQKAADSTILADFNTKFTSNGVTSRFHRDSSGFYVKTQGHDGQVQQYKVIYTFGVAPLQQYIVAFPDGSYQCLQTAWDTEKERWFDLQPGLTIEPGEWIHWTGHAMKWNTACADCHSTNLKKNLNPSTGSYVTTFSEISVGCEGCHGPGSLHADFYQRNSRGSKEPPQLHMTAGMSPKELVQKCARCHSRRSQITKYFDYEGDYFDHYEPQLITHPTYELDGQILDEDYVYASFIQSKMYREGVACNDCHDMHDMNLKISGNQLCISCHEPKYNTIAHFFHQPETKASQCISCHMTGKTYMGNDFRRDHSFRIPRPDQTMKYGTPNACNSCHRDKSPDWAAEAVRKIFGPDRQDHFSDHLIPGQQGQLAHLDHLLNDPSYPAIARASAVQYYGNYLEPAHLENILKFIKDQEPLVRNEVAKVVSNIRTPEVAEALSPLLKDEFRMVRKNAARALNNMGIYTGTGFEEAYQEYRAYLEMNADFPSTQFEIAENHQAKNQPELAIAAYEKALQIDNRYNIARLNLALLQYQMGKKKEAEALYLQVIELEPETSYPYYMLGLFYHEANESQKAEQYLKMACEKEPPMENAFYNYALMLHQNNEFEASIKVLNEGLHLFPYGERLHYIKLLSQMKLEDKNGARKTLGLLIQLNPQNSQYQDILKQLE